MPAALLSRDEVLDRLLSVFRSHGYDGASIAALSVATGLGRSSLYHYFPGGKDDMTRAVLARAAQWLETEIVAPLQGPGVPHQRLQAMIAALRVFYADGRKSCLLGNLCVGEARLLFQSELASAFRLWMDALADLAIEAGVKESEAVERAEIAIISIQGALVLSAGLNNGKPFQRMLTRLEEELLA